MTRQPYIPNARQRQQAHETALFGARVLGDPKPGFFAIRLVKGGVEVSARIERRPLNDPETGDPLDRSHYWFVTINGEPDPDPKPAPGERLWRVWESGRRIEETEYRFLLADRDWAAQHAPHLPEASPNRPIDHLTVPPPF